MKHLGISGGGTKIGGLFAAAETIIREKNYQPDVISGISAGAVLCVPIAMGKFDEIRQLVKNFDLKTFFSVSPVKANGKIRWLNAIIKVITRKTYLGKQGNLLKVLSRIISPDNFAEYQANHDYAVCIVGAVDFRSGGRVYMNLKTVTYSQFLQFVSASASLPLFTEGVVIKDSFKDFQNDPIEGPVLMYDGGVRDHIGTAKVLRSGLFSITETVSIFSRPEDYKLLSEQFAPRSILDILMRYVDINNVEVSKNDEFEEADYIEDHPNVTQHPTIYLPRIMQSVYDVNPGRLQQMYDAGVAAGRAWVPAGLV